MTKPELKTETWVYTGDLPKTDLDWKEGEVEFYQYRLNWKDGKAEFERSPVDKETINTINRMYKTQTKMVEFPVQKEMTILNAIQVALGYQFELGSQMSIISMREGRPWKKSDLTVAMNEKTRWIDVTLNLIDRKVASLGEEGEYLAGKADELKTSNEEIKSKLNRTEKEVSELKSRNAELEKLVEKLTPKKKPTAKKSSK